jgi:hypothetical protein
MESKDRSKVSVPRNTKLDIKPELSSDKITVESSTEYVDDVMRVENVNNCNIKSIRLHTKTSDKKTSNELSDTTSPTANTSIIPSSTNTSIVKTESKTINIDKSNIYDINKLSFVAFIRKIIYYNCYLKTLVNDGEVEVYNVKKYISSLIRELSNNHNIKMNFNLANEHNIDCNIYIIYNRRFDYNKSIISYYDESAFNGLILTDEGKVLCSPPRSFIIKNFTMINNNKHVNDNNYSAYIAIDGTIFTLYHYKEWHVSTAKGCLMDFKTFFGRVPMFDLIKNIFVEKSNKMGYSYTGEDLISNLDTNYCYTFRLSHHDWNLGVDIDSSDLVFIQAKHRETFEVTYDHKMLPEKVSNVIHGINPIPVQQALTIYKQSRNLQQFKPGCSNYIKNFAGIIFRSNSHRFKDILIESLNMEILRTFLYSHANKTKNIKVIALNHYFNIINPALLNTIGEVYKDFKMYFDFFDNEFNVLTKLIISQLHGNVKTKDDTYSVTAKFLIEHAILGNINGLNDFRLEHNIRDIIRNREYLPLYTTLWCE